MCELFSLSNHLPIRLKFGTPTGSSFCCHKLIRGQIRLKFGMWTPSKWVNVIDHMWV